GRRFTKLIRDKFVGECLSEGEGIDLPGRLLVDEGGLLAGGIVAPVSQRLCHVRGFYLSIVRGALSPHVYISMSYGTRRRAKSARKSSILGQCDNAPKSAG